MPDLFHPLVPYMHTLDMVSPLEKHSQHPKILLLFIDTQIHIRTHVQHIHTRNTHTRLAIFCPFYIVCLVHLLRNFFYKGFQFACYIEPRFGSVSDTAAWAQLSKKRKFPFSQTAVELLELLIRFVPLNQST